MAETRGRPRRQQRQREASSDDANAAPDAQETQATPEPYHSLQEQIAEAVEPLIEDLHEQLTRTVREAFEVDGILAADASGAAEAGQEDRPEEQSEDHEEARPDEQPQLQPEQVEADTQDEGEAAMAQDARAVDERPSRREGREEEDRGRDQSRRQDRSGEREDGERGRRDTRLARRDGSERRELVPAARRRPPARRLAPEEVFDARRAVPVALLRLANTARASGGVYTAIYAYMQVLERYPDTGAASAAVEGLLELADLLEQNGRFYTALNILNQLEELSY